MVPILFDFIKVLFYLRVFANNFNFALFFLPIDFVVFFNHFSRENIAWPMRAKAHKSHSIPEILCGV